MPVSGWIYSDLAKLISLEYNPYVVYFLLKYGKKILLGLLVLIFTGAGAIAIIHYAKEHKLSKEEVVEIQKIVHLNKRKVF